MDKVSGERESTKCRTDQREASVHGTRRGRNLFPTAHHVDPSGRFGASSTVAAPNRQLCKNTVGRVVQGTSPGTVGRFRASGMAQRSQTLCEFLRWLSIRIAICFACRYECIGAHSRAGRPEAFAVRHEYLLPLLNLFTSAPYRHT